jgi:SpoVK/Ycf46/Vps4 family AAA+-type ATPase
MTHIEPFLLNCDLEGSRAQRALDIEARLVKHAENLRFLSNDRPVKGPFELQKTDIDKIRRRVAKFLNLKAPPLRSAGHLKGEEKARLRTIAGGANVHSFQSPHQIDEIVSSLFLEMPWMSSALEPLLRDMHLVYDRENRVGFRPTILVGPPGIGKTHLAQRLSELTKLPHCLGSGFITRT